MNYLAHAFLSDDHPYEMMGNLWGDLLRPKDYPTLHPDLLEGIRRHRVIDAYTDQHPSVDVMINLLRPYQGKYTPVVADVLMDYMLSKYWTQFSPQPLETFCEVKYQVVNSYLYLIPESLHPRMHRMISHRWLESCKSRERMEETLRMLSRRASFENNIPNAMQAYDIHESQMDEMFLGFFEELQQHISLQNAG
jgi:acyl carrier protein phosphodiesterase